MTCNMSKILNTCDRLEKALKSYEETERSKERARALSEHREELKNKREALESAIQPWRILEHHQVAGLKRPTPQQGVTTGLPELYRRLAEESDSLNAGQVLNRCLKGLDNLEEKYREHVVAIWKKFQVGSLNPGVTDQLVQLFQALPDCQQAAGDLIEALEQHRQAVENPPNSEADWKRCQSAVERCRQLVKRLPLNDVPDEVKKFLRGVAADGAPLNVLTKDVLLWIEQNSLGGSFVIRAGSGFKRA